MRLSYPLSILALAALAHSAAAQGRRPDNEPRPGIYRAAQGEWRLDLPPAIEDAVDRAARDFEPWTAADYRESALGRYDYSPRQTPWAVIGDFNGDGRVDVAVAGRDDRDGLVLVVLSTGRKRYRAYRVDAEPYDPDEPRTLRPPVLSYLYPGRYVIDDPRLRHARELIVGQPAVQMTGGRRQGTVLYVVEDNVVNPYYLSASPAPPPSRPRDRDKGRDKDEDRHDRDSAHTR